MKRRIVTLLMILLPLLCCGCAKDAPKAAFLLYDGSDTFISEMMKKMEDAIPRGYEYVIQDAENSQYRQNQQIVALIEEGVDILVVNAVDRLACSSIVEKCADAGINVIFFNREPLEDALHGEGVYYVGADADSLGKKQADMVADWFGSDFSGGEQDKNGDGVVQLAILKGEQGHQDAEKRTVNCVRWMQAYGYQIELLETRVANWTRREGYEAMKELYTEYRGGLELVFSNNDDMALGAIDFLTEAGIFRTSPAGYEQPFVIVGVDGTAVGLEAIRDGLLYGTVLNDSTAQADAVITLMECLMKDDLGGYPYPVTGEHYIYIDGEIILQNNLSDFTEPG